MANFYDILGVSPHAEDVVIEGAYRALLKRYHPDVNRGDVSVAEARAKEITEAYQTLRDVTLRAQYDRTLRDSDVGDEPSDVDPDIAPTTSASAVSTPKRPGATLVSNLFILAAVVVLVGAFGSVFGGYSSISNGGLAPPESNTESGVEGQTLQDPEEVSATASPTADETPALEARTKVEPSFDCRRADTSILELICGDAALASADVKLASRYQDALRNSAEPELVRIQQRDWIARRNGASADVRTLMSIYQQRLSELDGLGASPESSGSLEPIY